MKILYDHQIFTWQDYGGISRYFCELMSQFATDPLIGFRLALRYSQNENLEQLPGLNRYWTARNDFFSDARIISAFQKKIHVNILNHIFHNQRESVKRIKAQDFNLFHPTYYDPYFLPHLGDKPYVLTIHDMIHEKFPNQFDKHDFTKNRKKLLAENAKQIIAVSENTKEDIIKFLQIPEEKVQVVFHADSLCQIQSAASQNPPVPANVPERYLLFVGNRQGYKNFTFLIRAIARVLEKDPDLHLVCAGGGSFTNSEFQLICTMNINTRVSWFPADDDTLRYLYKNAFAFIFPSLYEGFGIPVLEAFSCGCPALLSNTSSLPEVGGDAAVYFNPTDRDSLTDAIDRVLSDETFRKEIIQKGLARSKTFSWRKTAAMTKKVYEIATG